MRLERLSLSPCGPFLQHTFSFGSGLQVIYGPNEAGKSSTLKAVYALLYGFKEDELRFGSSEPRLHGVLASGSGQTVEFARRRGRKDTLLDEERRPLPADLLEPFLRGVSPKMFREFFGIDWKTLQEGSLQLLEDRGDLAESLFGASLGNGELKRLLKELDDKARDKFTPNTRTKGIAKLLSDCKQLEGELKNQTTRPEQFAKAQQELARAEKEATRLRRSQEQSRSRLLDLSRHCEALGLWQELQQYQDRRLALGSLPVLSRDFPSRRSAARAEQNKASAEILELSLQKQRLQQQLQGTDFKELWLQNASRLAELNERRAALQPVRQQLPARQAELARLKEEHQQLVRQLGLTSGSPCPSPLLRDRLQQCSEKLISERQNLESLHKSVAEREQRLVEAREQLQSLADTPDPLPLQLLAEESGRALTLSEQERKAARRAESLQRELQAAFQRLPLWNGSLEELLCYRPPLAAQREALAAELQRHLEQSNEFKRDLEKQQLSRDKLQQQYEEVSGDLPSADRLQEARQRREELWQLLQQDAEQRSSYEAAVRLCDEVTDRLLAGAERHARRQALLQQLQAVSLECHTLEKQLAETRHAQQSCQQAWEKLWAPLQPLQPAAMTEWVRVCDQVVQKHGEAAEAAEELGELRQRLDVLRQHLVQGLQAPPESSLEELHRRIRSELQALETPRARKRQLEGEIATLERDGGRDRLQAHQSKAQVEIFQREYEQALAACALPAETEPSTASTMLKLLARLDTVEQESRKLGALVEVQEQDLRHFEAETVEVATLLQEPVPQSEFESYVRSLAQKLAEEQERQRQRRELERRWEQLLADEQRQLVLLGQAEDTLQKLLVEAGVESLDQLPEMEERVERAQTLDLQIQEKRAALQRLLPEEALQKLGELDAATLQSELALEQQRLNETLERLREVDQRQGAARLQLEQLQERQGSVDKAQDLENLHNRILEESQQYLRLQLARGVLRKEVERYSQSRQQPLLEGTSRYFERLTRGRYQQVLADYVGGNDRQSLFGVRSGERVGVDAMSQGTRDQLYLALRLATLDHWMERRGAFPLVLDDLCVQFDDERAAATLAVLAELGQRTQVLYFTHLQRDVELVRGLPCDLHTLPQPCLETEVAV